MPIRSRVQEIVALRAQLGLSQTAFGRELGVDQATVSRWERGVQAPDPRARVRLSDLMYRLDATRSARPEVALVEHSPFPMAIVSKDWVVVALSRGMPGRAQGAGRDRNPKRRKHATADMERAVAQLRDHGFFNGKIGVARIVARGFVLWADQRPFEAICTPVVVDGEVCRLMQYELLSEMNFANRRKKHGLLTILDQ